MKKKLTGLVAIAALALSGLAGCSTPGGDATSNPPADTTSTAATGAPDSGITLPADVTPGFTVPGDSDKGGKNNPVKIGVVGAGGEQFQVLTKAALAEGIYLKFQDFTDYAQPNPALSEGELDLNQFQHIIYLANYNISEKKDLTPIGSTAIYPLGLYSKQYKSVDEIPAGATITLPDDQTNQARGLAVLQAAGLLKLKEGTPSLFASVGDVDTANSKVTVKAVAADQTARSLDDAGTAGAIINNDYIADTGLTAQDAIAQDDPSSDGAAPFINIWVSRAQDKDLPLFAEIVRLAHSEEWNAALLANSAGTGVLVNETPARLQEVLADVQQQKQNA
ncbi:MAG: methionine ABC transporter substrate-binding protein [Propionibacteriaceae bacterium]|jgi:D-methionine transport system substrate-binding protein|nr:methionine ABC transporter substrate-binding protein [Propionibacteriaceae bacterium]